MDLVVCTVDVMASLLVVSTRWCYCCRYEGGGGYWLDGKDRVLALYLLPCFSAQIPADREHENAYGNARTAFLCSGRMWEIL